MLNSVDDDDSLYDHRMLMMNMVKTKHVLALSQNDMMAMIYSYLLYFMVFSRNIFCILAGHN